MCAGSIKPLQREKPGLVRHGEVEQHDVWLKLPSQRHCFVAVARLACDRQAALRLEQLAEALAKEGLVVGDHDPNWINRTSHHRLKPLIGRIEDASGLWCESPKVAQLFVGLTDRTTAEAKLRQKQRND